MPLASAPPTWPSKFDSDRAHDTRERLDAFMFVLDELGHQYELSELAARCGLHLTGTRLLGPNGADGDIFLLEPDDGPLPDDVLGVVVILAGLPYDRAVLFTRPRA